MKVGDKVRAKTTGWKGKEGVIVKPSLNSRYDWLVCMSESGKTVVFREDELVSVGDTTGPTDAEIDAALEAVKANNGLCEEFDEAVEEARTMTFLQRLDHVAIARGRGDLFLELEETLFKPKFKKGDVVTGQVSGRKFVVTGPSSRRSDCWIATRLDDGKELELFEENMTPSDWEVGDTVPAETVVGREWVGVRGNRPYVFRADEIDMYPRKIVWLGPKREEVPF